MHKHSLIAPVLLGIFLAAALLPDSASAQPPPFLTQWGSLGSADGQFNFPRSVALDVSGNGRQPWSASGGSLSRGSSTGQGGRSVTSGSRGCEPARSRAFAAAWFTTSGALSFEAPNERGCRAPSQ